MELFLLELWFRIRQGILDFSWRCA